MKNFYLPFLFSFLLTFGITNSIQAQGCEAGTATETLDAANSTITLSSSGLWALDLSGNTPSYEWPKTATGQGPGLIFAGNLWFGGYDDGGNLKVAAKTYGVDANNGYWPGPYGDEFSSDPEFCTNWDRLFKVDGQEIESFQADYEDNQQIDDPIPNSILGWPARGNSFFNSVYGFELPDVAGGLAPFYDQNFDGIYDPMAGDYPQIKCADEAVWWVFHDDGNANSAGTNPMQIEVQMLAYVYSSNEENINNASFYDVKFINRGTEPLDSLFAGLWIDADLGCPFDDYLGSVPEENLTYFYNADATDGEGSGNCNGVPSYDEPPMFGLKLLKGPRDNFGGEIDMSSSIFYYNGGGIPTPPPYLTDPAQAYEYYNYLTGRRKDGGNFLTPDNEPTNFVYPDNPANTPNGWSMCAEETLPADLRSVFSIGPVRLSPGQENDFTFAVVVQPQPALPCPDVAALIAAADMPAPTDINNSFCNLTVGISEDGLTPAGLSVFPNPATDLINFQLSDNESFASIRLYSMDGQLVRQEENLHSSMVELHRGDLATGTYVYQILTQDATSASGKIILK